MELRRSGVEQTLLKMASFGLVTDSFPPVLESQGRWRFMIDDETTSTVLRDHQKFDVI